MTSCGDPLQILWVGRYSINRNVHLEHMAFYLSMRLFIGRRLLLVDYWCYFLHCISFEGPLYSCCILRFQRLENRLFFSIVEMKFDEMSLSLMMNCCWYHSEVSSFGSWIIDIFFIELHSFALEILPYWNFLQNHIEFWFVWNWS